MLIVIERGEETFEVEDRLALLPLRDVVLYPYVTSSLLVGRAASVSAVEEAVSGDRVVFVTAQKRPDIAEPGTDDLYRVGTVVRIVQLFRHPDGTLRVLVEGLGRARAKSFEWGEEHAVANIEPVVENVVEGKEIEALARSMLNSFNDYVRLSRRIPDEVLLTINNTPDPVKLSYLVAANLQVRVATKQQVLAAVDLKPRLSLLARILASELEIVKLEHKIEGEVRSQVHRNQKEFYLNEQLKAIRKELGHQNEFSGELDELAEQIKKARMPKPVYEKAMRELDRLGKMAYMSPEATVVRNYLDWLVALPWAKRTKDNLDMEEVERILADDHYSLRKVKDRIPEYLAVLKLSGKIKGPILCFVGPPGVGKTSLGRSIARALGRKFVRVSLGGVRDEAEIRGHRRTYIGSMPGRIIQSVRRAGTRNPVFLLDEVDKLGVDYRGDPSAALLEALDPEQNHSFSDHYMEVDFDLSEVMFITTANVLHTIPPALRDRMEVIRLPGYLDFEKAAIARQFLLPKQMEGAGLAPGDLKLSDSALNKIITSYTREAGVRNLEREISAICRKVARSKAKAKGKSKSGQGRNGHRARLDGSRRRSAHCRGVRASRQGQAPPDGKARGGDERVRACGAELHQVQRAGDRVEEELLRQDGRPRPHSGGRDSQGRSIGGRGDGHGARVRPDRHPHAQGSGYDRRDHSSRQSPCGGGAEREDGGRIEERSEDRARAEGEREGSLRAPGGGSQEPGSGSRRDDGRSPRARAGREESPFTCQRGPSLGRRQEG